MVIWYQVFLFNANNFQIDLFGYRWNSYDRVKVDVVVMAVKGYPPLPKTGASPPAAV